MTEKDKAYALLLYQFLKQHKGDWSAGKVSVTVTTDQGHLELAQKLSTEYAEYGFSIQSQGKYVGYHEIAAGEEVTFELAPQRSNRLFHAQNVADLLSLKSGLIDRPREIIVQELDYLSFESKTQPPEIAAYYHLNTFLNQLINLAVLEGRTDEDLLLFFASGTLKVTAKTDGDTLKQNAGGIVGAINLILSILAAEIHKNDKVRLLKAVLYDSWRNVDAGLRMRHFVQHSEEIARNFSNNYELFVSEFSFDSATEKLVKEQHEFSSRLSDILTSIQGRILAIPLSLILAFGQMKTAPEDNPLLINTGILLAAIVFAILMWYLLNSQDQVLHNLKQELDSKIVRFKLNIPSLYQEVEDNFIRLEKQYRSTWNMLLLLKGLIVVGLIVTLIAWIFLTPELRDLFTT